ncbi:ABC transporter substrate-binding protein [Ideonella azotifigens]|uniref:ABC transporter substrate-binding protein n=1 Tax=Ideonella azotifigens TaxID=513160 RepID=UPI00114247B7|nr:ABC transporter substrate-binding protein [Ideonella azotifigens]MCD2341770.1 ABC transporter substrate-binding protein [Ideonella azotifigens]
MSRRRQFLVRSSALALAATGLPVARAADEALGPQQVTLGCSLAMTGPLGGAGTAHVAGIKAAFRAVNENGGINGRNLRLAVRDDAYVATRTLENVKGLLDGNAAFALMSCMGTANTAAILPLIEQAGVPCVGPVTGAASLRRPDLRQVFHVRASYSDEAIRVVQQLVSMGLKDIALVYLDNPFGKEVLRDAEAALSDKGLKSIGQFALAVNGANAGELSQQVLAARPGAVLLVTTGSANTALVLALRSKAGGLPMVGLSVSVIASELPRLGAAAKGMAMTQVFPDAEKTKLAAVRQYQAEMKALGDEHYDASSFEGWVNAQMMMEGLRRAGRDLSRDKLRQALASIKRLDLGDYSLGYAGAGPFVASRFIELAVMGADGHRVG